jgi:hypothetical protein
MTRLQTLLGIALTGALLTTGLTASAQPTKPGFATVVRVKGIASYSLGDDRSYPIVAGKFLPPGAVIKTGDDGVVDVVLGKSIDLPQAPWAPSHISQAVDAPVRGLVAYKPTAEQNVVRVLANSILVIDKLTTTDTGADTVSDTELNLKKGSIFASVKKLSPAAQYLIKTPTGIAGVRGTEVAITLNDDGSIQSVAVYHTHQDDGLVLAVTLPNGTTQTYLITEGQVWTPGNPTPVPVTPELRSLLRAAFSALRTSYFEVVNYDYNHNTDRESTDTGNF